MMGTPTPVPDAAFVLALATLPDIGPARLDALLEDGGPIDAWQEVVEGRAHLGAAAPLMGRTPQALSATWARVARAVDPGRLWRAHIDAGLHVMWRHDAEFPAVLQKDPHGPALLVGEGDLSALDGPRVAIVGTRDCTHAGRDTAVRLARELTDSGVRVVSGLALGIDAGAHSGALASGAVPPIAVVGSGLDVVYPRRNVALWRRVAAAGLVLTEHPLGAEPVGWHFLARNRIIAALSDAVVVVESHEHGGALQTATEAARRGVPVLAVPGSVHSSASKGTNALLRDAFVCCDTTDVLLILGLTASRASDRAERRPPPGDDAVVLDAIGWEPCPVEQLMSRTGRDLGEVASALDRLERAGWVVRRGGWTERVGETAR